MSVASLKECILPAAFTKDGWKFVECELDSNTVGQDQFQSNVVFLTAVVLKDETIRKISLVIKFEPFNEIIRNELCTNLQFHNELVMYSQVLPFLDKNNICADIFPEFYYGISTIVEPEKDVILVEDLRPKGFKLTEQKGFVDYPHLKLALKTLGRFHALSYAAKKENPDDFLKMVKLLQETSWTDKVTAVLPTIQHCFHRAIDPLVNQGRHTDVLSRLLSRVDNSVVKFLRELVAIEEPMAVLCHGDFCRNNMLFKYDQQTPTDVKFFDVATARYSSPAVDIAFFLLMNSSREVRAAHWDDLLSVYHEALSSAVHGLQVPSLEDLREEMRQKTVYGFVHCSYFLPIMLYKNDFSPNDMIVMTPDELGRKLALIGGEEGTQMLIGIVEELIERGCLTLQHPFLQI